MHENSTELLRLIERFEWLYRSNADAVAAQTIRQSLDELKASVAGAGDAFENQRTIEAQQELENALMHLLTALRRMGASPDEALCRAWQRAHKPAEKAFHVYPDRVEVRVAGNVEGSWPLFTVDDYRSFVELARSLGCPVVHHDMRQLELF